MRVIDDRTLIKLKKSRKIKPDDANRLLVRKKPASANPPSATKDRALEALVLSVASAVNTNSELNKEANKLLRNLFVLVSEKTPAPPAPTPARHWQVTVTKRDADKLISTVDLVRIDND